MALTVTQINQLYVSYFGRPADFQGVQFYQTANATPEQVAAAFAASAESQALFGTASVPSVINAIYQNLFNRDAEPAGLTYWTQQVQQGKITAAAAALAIGNGAVGTDATTVANKVLVANAFVTALDTTAEILGYSGDAAASTARAFIKTVTATNLATVQATVDANVAAAVASGGPAGSTFVLTTAGEILAGTAGNDIFSATDSTLTVADSVDGGNGNDTLNFVWAATATGALPSANIKNVETFNVRATTTAITSSDLSAYAGLTAFNSDRSSTNITTVNLAKGASYGVSGDGATVSASALAFGYASAADVATLNVNGGTKGTAAVTLTGSGVTSTIINSNGTVANTLGTTTVAATSKAITINALANLTTTLNNAVGVDTKLTATGTATIDLTGTAFAAALNNTITTIDASAQTSGGLKVVAGTSTTLKFTGGAGADTLGLGAVLATGAAVDGGAGTDTLYVGANTTYITSATGALIKNFEVVDVTTATVDLDNLAPTNTLTGLRVGGSATVSNINAATSGAITVYASATPILNVKGATTPGQLDTVVIDVNDGATAVGNLTLTAPTLTGVETLKLTATENVTITSLANALALNAITFTGAGNISLTTTGIAVNANSVIDASAATGNLTVDATGTTANGYTIKGSAGTNVLTAGAAPVSADLTKSAAKADQVIITSATGSSINALTATVSGFTNATTTGDKLDVINTAVIAANAAAGTATGVTNLTATVTNGVITFGGTAAATASFSDKVSAAATLAGATIYTTIAFENAGNTYILEQGNANADYLAGTDVLVQLTGVTGVTALSTTASAANTVFVA